MGLIEIDEDELMMLREASNAAMQFSLALSALVLRDGIRNERVPGEERYSIFIEQDDVLQTSNAEIFVTHGETMGKMGTMVEVKKSQVILPDFKFDG